MTEPFESSLALLAELRRMQLRALVLIHRAKSARVRVLKAINEKAAVGAAAGKGNHE